MNFLLELDSLFQVTQWPQNSLIKSFRSFWDTLYISVKLTCVKSSVIKNRIGCCSPEHLVAMSKNWSVAVDLISFTFDIRTKSMINWCHDTSLIRLSRHWKCKAMRKIKTPILMFCSANRCISIRSHPMAILNLGFP